MKNNKKDELMTHPFLLFVILGEYESESAAQQQVEHQPATHGLQNHAGIAQFPIL